MLKFSRLLILFALLALTALPTVAQSEATTFVLDAFANLNEGYHFEFASQTSLGLSTDDSETTTYTDYVVSGNADSNFNYSATASVIGYLSPEENTEHAESEVIDFEQVLVDGIRYINIGDEGEDLIAPFLSEIGPGWHRLVDLEDILTGVSGAAIASITNIQLPTVLPVDANSISSVTEGTPTELNGVSVRVFDVVLDAETVYTTTMLESNSMQLEEILSAAALLAAGEFEFHSTFWIGADDGKIYRMTGEYLSLVPYLRVGQEQGIRNLPPYDIKTTGMFQYDFSNHGAVDPVTPPEL